jgi:hypothetical protein
VERVAKLKEKDKAKEIDDQPFVDKAAPRPPLRVLSMEWDSAPEPVATDAFLPSSVAYKPSRRKDNKVDAYLVLTSVLSE